MRVWEGRKDLNDFSSLYAVSIKNLLKFYSARISVSLNKQLTKTCWMQRMDSSKEHTCGLCKLRQILIEKQK